MTNSINIYPDKYSELKSYKTNFLKLLLLIDIICLYFLFQLILKYTKYNKTHNYTIYKTDEDRNKNLDIINKIKKKLIYSISFLIIFNIFIYLLFMSIYKNRTLKTQLSITFLPLILLYKNKFITLCGIVLILVSYFIYNYIKNKKEIEIFQNNTKNIIEKFQNNNNTDNKNNITKNIINISIIFALVFGIYKLNIHCSKKYLDYKSSNSIQNSSLKKNIIYNFNCYFITIFNILLLVFNKIYGYLMVLFDILYTLIILLLPCIFLIFFFYITVKWFISIDNSGEKTFGKAVY